FLETNLFNAGVRPAINVGISVSRVGGNAQIKSMKKIAGTLKIDQAQYRELEAFSKFGSDLDPATMTILEKGKRNVEILKQGIHQPMPVEKQIAIIYCGTHDLLKTIPVNRIHDFETDFLNLLSEEYPEILQTLRAGQLPDEITQKLEEIVATLVKRYE
ncbi:MAG TPA: F0F1 ATP synthase subunit alpha, partial [Bacteroidales bacterium]|nr:F0F1 ATP synthase subunit alpha [Bacteroidales bacterium]